MTRKPIPCGHDFHGFNVWTDFYFYPFLVSALVPPPPLCGARVISCIIVALNLTTLASEGPLPTTYIPKQQSFVSAHISPFAANLQAQVVTCDGEKQIRWTYGCLFLGGFFLGGGSPGKTKFKLSRDADGYVLFPSGFCWMMHQYLWRESRDVKQINKVSVLWRRWLNLWLDEWTRLIMSTSKSPISLSG